MTTTVAALYVERNGVYDRPGVDLWDEQRDARRYAGPWPVVAHPPCSSWCRLAHLIQSVYGHAVGDDGGCFEAALASVRAFGGVLEQPAFSYAWPRYGLQQPKRGAWQRDFFDPAGGWVTEVFQAAYGCRANKRTWLYWVGNGRPLTMCWRRASGAARVGFVKFSGKGLPNRIPDGGVLSKKEAKATPPAFADALLDLARSAVQ